MKGRRGQIRGVKGKVNDVENAAKKGRKRENMGREEQKGKKKRGGGEGGMKCREDVERWNSWNDDMEER